MRAITDAPAGRARLLSFDGGGIRGLFALQYAKRIETLLREKSGNPDLVLADHFLDVLSQAKLLPSSLIDSFLQYQDLLCRVHGECRYGPSVDGEVGDLARPSGDSEFLYAGYDKIFTEEDLNAAALVTKGGFTLDNLELMDFLCEAGTAHAEQVVKLSHFEDE
ncbi:MAG: hypothetical protein IZT59_07585 [Verrucomicrobia bacterium]|jgi:hypothetical protein|nr:hypothetical protein [Verrucomicrobiota bacterium]|tara:strand:+ start:6322 stop:6813 length:492 start_codon:yes stop_codon:yes gene_type:complete